MTDPPTIAPTRCCIAGGGPAGMMLGFLLAREGVPVIVLEKHADFLRDFRGDTIHPSTLEVMHELGVLDQLLERPHQEVREIAGQIGNDLIPLADFSRLPTHCQFLAFMPQWDFLDFIKERASRYPTFALRMETEVVDLVEERGTIAGVRANTPGGEIQIRSDLVIGADGRASVVRDRAHLPVENLGAPIDVLWFRLSRRATDPGHVLGRFVAGRIMVMLNRDSYWQCGFVIPKGAFEEIKGRGLDAFRSDIKAVAPFLEDRVGELQNWTTVKLLTVLVNRLRRWYRPGLLCLGDAAHAMSPVGGVGINLAIQDAVAAANILAGPLLERSVSLHDLQQIQRRRELPTKITQWAQVQIHKRVFGPGRGGQPPGAPAVLRLFKKYPVLRRIPARLIGIGVRAEHVRRIRPVHAGPPDGDCS
jgi:2-polyprenyl-6-methoxyphenol hydroxylase-like FAD-dependent oxidoreductase